MRPNYQLYNNDCIDQLRQLPDNHFGFSVFSPPFAELYTYSDDIRDMGNSKDYDEFFTHFSYLTPELYRTLKPGRLIAVHCMDVSLQKGKDGVIGLKDFSGDLVKAFTDQGFIYHCRVTIWKNPVTEMQRTKALGLLHKTIKKDSSMSRVGGSDYILVFRKDGENENPIVHQDKDPAKENYLPVDLWQKYASPVWYDINYSNTLQYRSARADKDEKHICPLQLETIERCLHLWSNEGDTVLSPFAGIGSEGHEAIKLNRNFVGIELKPSYFNQMKKNLEALKKLRFQMELF
ncbi:MAG: site-specific DNA-methyltransferase [Flavobacteriaceae bacterium]|nr:site-specific DNA-methyltransferase [Flavobacteriaceae bacterium]